MIRRVPLNEVKGTTRRVPALRASDLGPRILNPQSRFPGNCLTAVDPFTTTDFANRPISAPHPDMAYNSRPCQSTARIAEPA